MTSFNVEKVPGEPIIIHTMHENWDTRQDIPAANDEIVKLMDDSDEPIFLISIIESGVSFNFHDVIWATNQVARGQDAPLHHPNLRRYLVVTQIRVLDLAAKGLGSEAFGIVPVSVFSTLEEALAHARSQ